MNDDAHTLEHDTATGAPLVSDGPADPKVEPITTEVGAYDPIAAALAHMRHEFSGRAYDLTTVKGNDAARRDRKRLVSLRTGLERLRADMNRDDRKTIEERIELRNREAARLTSLIVDLEAPIDDQIRVDEQRREEERLRKIEAERVRVAGIRQRIEQIGNVARRAVGRPSAEIEGKIRLVVAVAIDASFAEFAPEGATVKDETLTQLRDLHALTVQAEQRAAEIERAEHALREREAEQKRRDAEAAAERLRQVEADRAQRAAQDLEERDRMARQQAELHAREQILEAAAEEQRQRQARLDAEAAERRAEEDRQAEARRAEQQRLLDEQAAEIRRQHEAAAAVERERQAEAARKAEEEHAEQRREQEAKHAAEQRVRDQAPAMLALLIEIDAADESAVFELASDYRARVRAVIAAAVER